jgi:hypothetical protein
MLLPAFFLTDSFKDFFLTALPIYKNSSLYKKLESIILQQYKEERKKQDFVN